jgi:hypothetical protein
MPTIKIMLMIAYCLLKICTFNRRVPYEGSLDDGRYWDTILAVFGLTLGWIRPTKAMHQQCNI